MGQPSQRSGAVTTPGAVQEKSRCGSWFSKHGGDGLTFELDGLGGLIQP